MSTVQKSKSARALLQSAWADFKKSQSPFDRFDPALSDSNFGKLYVLFKCFRDADATVKFVSSNSSSKIFGMAILANSDKPGTLKIADSSSDTF